MKCSSWIAIIFAIVYFVSSLGSLFILYRVENQSNFNPLDKGLTSEDFKRIFEKYPRESQVSYIEALELRKNKHLRLLMDEEKCDDYTNKILELSSKIPKNSNDTKSLNEVFGVNISFLNLATNSFFYILCVVLLLVIYSYFTLILSYNCYDRCVSLVYPCFPFFVIFLFIFSFLYLVLLFVLIYHYFWGSINDFIEFVGCPSVNQLYFANENYEIFELKDNIKYCLIVLVFNYVICLIHLFFSFREKATVKEYHSFYLGITDVNHSDSIN